MFALGKILSLHKLILFLRGEKLDVNEIMLH